jgi:hypothetical protein
MYCSKAAGECVAFVLRENLVLTCWILVLGLFNH